MKTISILLMLLSTLLSMAQNEARDQVEAYLAAVRDGRPLPQLDAELLGEQSRMVLDLTGAPAKAQSYKLRFHSALLAWRVARTSKVTEIRLEAVDRLGQAALDGSPKVHQHARKYLLTLPVEDFSAATKQALYQQFLQTPRPRLIRLMGKLQMAEALPKLKELAEIDAEKSRVGDRTWSATLALARMGDSAAETLILKRFQEREGASLPNLLQDLAFVSTENTLSAIRPFLDQNNTEGAPERDIITIPNSQYALHALATEITNFPVKPQPTGTYSMLDIQQAKTWYATRR